MAHSEVILKRTDVRYVTSSSITSYGKVLFQRMKVFAKTDDILRIMINRLLIFGSNSGLKIVSPKGTTKKGEKFKGFLVENMFWVEVEAPDRQVFQSVFKTSKNLGKGTKKKHSKLPRP